MERRQFLKRSARGALALGLTAPLALRTTAGARQKQIEWCLERGGWESLGEFDFVPQLDEGMQWGNRSLLRYGTVEPPNNGNRCMRGACMPAEACAHYYSMTGDATTLEALKAAVKTFRKYRHKAKGRRVPYEEITEPIESELVTEKTPTISYEAISCHVGRNMRGARAAAHALKDETLLREVAEELAWWIDTPLAFNHDKHFFDARVFVDENNKGIASERRYTMNMGGSLACAMWLVGNDLGDERLMRYGADQILRGIAPHQDETGYFPYNIEHDYEMVDGIALDSNYYHALTLQVISSLLAYRWWQEQPTYVNMMRRGTRYLRRMMHGSGVMKQPPHIAAIRYRRGRCPKDPFDLTADSILTHTRMYKYLGDEEALDAAAKNLRWMHWNSPSCMPFLATDTKFGMDHIVSEKPFSHSFRQVVLAAWEGMHLKRKGLRDVEAVFVG